MMMRRRERSAGAVFVGITDRARTAHGAAATAPVTIGASAPPLHFFLSDKAPRWYHDYK